MNKLILTLTTLLFSFSIFAADGSSGCGPGWYVFKENSILSSALRATTNGILFPSTTFGMTFGTSNCSKHKLVKTEKESLQFATENYYEILTEASRGEGEFLSSFASTLGCQPEDFDAFGKEVKKNYQKVFKNRDVNPENLLREVYIMILSNKKLTYSCSLS